MADLFPMPRVLDFPPRVIDLQDRRRQLRNERERQKRRRRSVIIFVSTASIGCLAIGLCSFLAFLAFINYYESSDNISNSSTSTSTTSTSTSTTTSTTTTTTTSTTTSTSSSSSTSTSTSTSTTTSTTTTTTTTSDIITYTPGQGISDCGGNWQPGSETTDPDCQNACTASSTCSVYYFDPDSSSCSFYDSTICIQEDQTSDSQIFEIKTINGVMSVNVMQSCPCV